MSAYTDLSLYYSVCKSCEAEKRKSLRLFPFKDISYRSFCTYKHVGRRSPCLWICGYNRCCYSCSRNYNLSNPKSYLTTCLYLFVCHINDLLLISYLHYRLCNFCEKRKGCREQRTPTAAESFKILHSCRTASFHYMVCKSCEAKIKKKRTGLEPVTSSLHCCSTN